MRTASEWLRGTFRRGNIFDIFTELPRRGRPAGRVLDCNAPIVPQELLCAGVRGAGLLNKHAAGAARGPGEAPGCINMSWRRCLKDAADVSLGLGLVDHVRGLAFLAE